MTGQTEIPTALELSNLDNMSVELATELVLKWSQGLDNEQFLELLRRLGF